MNYFLFMPLSILEAAAIFCLSLKVYRFHLSEFTWQILVSSFIVSFVSYMDRLELNLGGFDVIAQLLVYLILLKTLFRVPLLYSGLLSLTGFSGNVIIQFIVYAVMVTLGVISSDDVQSEISNATIILQFISIILTYSLTFLLHTKHLGFSFVPHGRRVRFNKKNKMLLALIIISFVGIGTCFYIYYSNHLRSIAISGLVFTVILVSLLYMSFQKETCK